MPFPNHEGKHAGRPYVTARRLLGYHESRGNARAAAPRAVVLTWQARLENRVRERRDHQELHRAGVGSVLLQLTPDLGLARLPIGAPAAAIAVEELSARGDDCHRIWRERAKYMSSPTAGPRVASRREES
jgi:hypothetical protein